ncbi:aminoglycoside phosphotransferase (APT) family kinase protein [Planomicrobium stackebrandtii]|uniref:Aminoglycoside phosphotransferase (APT) family kinase protein n=1 Tax=Planomicrobium stackebrandtii TaxID=253160 RepID=A0ABU0H082_9BACL|nr:phosphotransferase family protein [Planomicrobium stackebrandtii]MDQ0430210.1 aminoglycoside phosphotransferase (APT) family kinase protein [Planomicrobium stackebrandtii]
MVEQKGMIITVRSGEGLNKKELEQFLRKNIKDLPQGELRIHQFGTGHSNLTYALQIGSWEAVLRRPPLGPVAPKAHDMEREFKILSALYPIFKTAPKPLVYSEDASIIGSPFFIMERRHGIVLDNEFPEGIEPTEELGRKISEKMVDTLVELHSLDYRKTALADMAKPEGFMQRQVEGWIGRYERAQTDKIEGIDQLMGWMLANIPVSQAPAIIHYDFKLNNAMFSEDFSEMTGLFDWEMTTVGDPLADLGAAMSYWIQAEDPDLLKNGLGKAPVTVLKGFYSREEFIASYGEKSGRDVSDMNFYLTFAYFKLAVIIQQIYYRYKKGQTQDPRFAHFDQFVKSLMAHALATASKK